MAFFPIEQKSNLQDGYQKAFTVAGKSLLLIQVNGQVYLLENRCPHMDVPLDRAQLLATDSIRCKAHGIEFDLASGKARGALADVMAGLKKYPIVYQGDVLGVDS